MLITPALPFRCAPPASRKRLARGWSEATAAGDLHQSRHKPHGRTAVRLALVAVAAAQLTLALPGLVGRVHSGNEAAAWGVATAVGLLTAAASPPRVPGMLPLLSAAALVQVLITAHDVAASQVHLGHELPHGLLITGLGLLWLLRDHNNTPFDEHQALSRPPAPPGTTRKVA